MPAGLHRSARIAPEAPREEQREGRQERGCSATPAPSQPRSPQNACDNPRGATLGLCPLRRDVRGAGGGDQVGCDGATSSHWDTAGTGPVLQLSPANPGLSQGRDQLSCPALEQPRGHRLQPVVVVTRCGISGSSGGC